MHRTLTSLCLFSALLLLPIAAIADETVSIKAGYLSLTPEGSFASRSDFLDTEIDLEDDVDFDKSEEMMAEAAFQLGSFRLSLGYLPLKFSGTSTLDEQITFEGQTFNIASTVKGEMDVDLYDLGLTWYLVNTDDLPVRVQFGPELSVKLIDGEVSLEEIGSSIREEVSGTVPVPTIGLRARVALGDYLGLIGRVGYIEYSDNTFLDADVQLELSPVPFVGIFGGYRYLDLEVDEDDLFIDARFSGPFAGAFVRF